MAGPETPGPGPIHLLTHEFLPFTGGIGVYVEETARALARLGADITVWAPAYPETRDDGLPFRTNRIPMRGQQGWLCRLRLALALRHAFPGGRIPGTVVLAEPGPIRLWMYRRFMNLPRPDRLVVLLHGSEIQGLSRIAHRRQLFRQLLRSADRVGVVSGTVREMATQLSPEIASKLVRVPGAVRSSWQDLPPVPRSVPPACQEILQVGRIHPRKGQDILIQAISLLPDDLCQSVRVRLVGPVSRPRYAAELEQLILKLGLPVQMEGSLPEAALQEAYATATLLAMPSQPFQNSIEGLGLALLEAQHFGCPVIASLTGGVAEALRVEETGLLVPPGDPHALAHAIESLLRHPERAQAMGMAGARFIRQTFSWNDNLRQLGLV